jgi:hypothetical protein
MEYTEIPAQQLVALINDTYGKRWSIEKTLTGIWITMNATEIPFESWRDAYMFLAGVEYCLKYGDPI